MSSDNTEHYGNVAVHLDHYSGRDAYSDGDVEEKILEFCRRGLTFEQALAEDDSWPVVYHLSPIRENLLSWYPFDADCRLLEIGAGCGAVTGVLCDRVGEVVANELSKRRAEILATRHQDRENLKVVVGNLNEVKFCKPFDVVTLVGVLEYAERFTPGPRPHIDFLRKIKEIVKPGGRVLIAIENRFGLKYWSGAREDHTSRFFDGIEGYRHDDDARTFSRSELAEKIAFAGLTVEQFYYPMPDYKFPIQIFSDRALPSRGDLEVHVPNYQKGEFRLFDEDAAFEGLIDLGLFAFFANSFFVDCRVEGE